MSMPLWGRKKRTSLPSCQIPVLHPPRCNFEHAEWEELHPQHPKQITATQQKGLVLVKHVVVPAYSLARSLYLTVFQQTQLIAILWWNLHFKPAILSFVERLSILVQWES